VTPDLGGVSPLARIAVRVLWVLGAGGLTVFAVGAAIGHDGSLPTTVKVLEICLFLVPAALCLLRAALVREERLAWACFGIGMLSWAAGYLYYFVALEDLASPPYPSPSDALWLGYYLGAFVGLMALLRSRLRSFRRSLWIDALVGGLAIGALGAALLVDPILDATGGSVAAVATNMAYPLFDLLIVSVVLGAFALCGWRPGRTWLLFGAVFSAQAVSDAIFLHQVATGTYEAGTLLDATHPGLMLLVALAAWQKPQVTEGVAFQGWPAMAITSAFAVIGLGLTAYDHWHSLPDVAMVMATLTLVAAFVRTAMAFGDMRSLTHTRRLLERNELILNAAGDGICGLDRQGLITFVNPAAAAMTGYATSELLGRPIHATLHHTRCDGTSFPFEECPVWTSLQNGAVRRVDHDGLYWRKDGSSFPVEYNSTPVLEDGRVEGAVVVFKDITERRAAGELLEHQRRQLIEAQSVGGVGSWEWDIAANTVQWSDQQCRIYGIAPGGHPRSMEEVAAYTHPDDRVRWQAQLRACLASGEPLAYERRIVHPDGSVHITETHGEIIADDQGTALRMVGTNQDITERYELERAKSEFVSIVSHELRTPLTSIRGSLGLLESGVLGAMAPQGRRMVEIAVQNTDRLVRLINDILDIERINSGQIDMHPVPCDARELIARATDAVAALARDANVTVVADAHPVSLSADPDRIIQALTNLIGNAVKFSEPGSTVRVACARRDAEVLFEICDDGRGIPADQLEPIFGRFAQVDASDARQKGGTGLGLAICRSIIDQHGGRIWAESVPGHGATLSFVLPAPPGAGEIEPSGGPRGRTVLVCDDDPAVVEVVRSLLVRRGYRVIAAHSGEQALEHAFSEHPDVILLDLLMPGMSGWETAAALAQHAATRDIPVVILSVLAQAETPAPTGQIVDWVSKPLDDAQLFIALKRAVSGRDEPFTVLVVEDDRDLAGVMRATFARHGIETVHAVDGAQAIRISERVLPDLLVLDIGLPEVDGFEVVEWLRRHKRLHAIPTVIYTARDLDGSDRTRLRLGSTTQFLTKGRVTPVDFEQRVLALLERIAPADREESTDERQAHPAGR